MAHDFEGPPSVKVLVFFSPVAELIFASNLATSKDPGLEPVDEEWRRQQREQLGEEATAYLDLIAAGIDWPMLSLCDYLPISGLYESWEDFRAFVEARDIDDFIHTVLNGEIPRGELSALYKNPSGAATWAAGFSSFSKMSPKAAVRIFSEPELFRRQLLSYVGANRTPAFESRLELLRPRFEARMGRVREGLVGKDPLAFAEELTKKTCSFPRELRSYSFVPSYFLGRKNLFSLGSGNLLLAFSLDARVEDEAEGAEEIADLMKVLGDRTRLDILRLLAEGPSYGKAIADRLGLTTASVSRQLDQLKSAGLVLEDRADSSNIKLLKLETAAMDDLFRRTRGFLKTPSAD